MSTRRSPTEPTSVRIQAQFVKSNFYRVVHADGAFGGLTASGHIRMAIYSEAQRLPDVITYSLTPGQGLAEVSRDPQLTARDMTRELEVDIVMTVDVARTVRDWLDGKVKELEALQHQTELQMGEQQ